MRTGGRALGVVVNGHTRFLRYIQQQRGKQKEKVFGKKVLEACSFTQNTDGAGWDDADG